LGESAAPGKNDHSREKRLEKRARSEVETKKLLPLIVERRIFSGIHSGFLRSVSLRFNGGTERRLLKKVGVRRQKGSERILDGEEPLGRAGCGRRLP